MSFFTSAKKWLLRRNTPGVPVICCCLTILKHSDKKKHLNFYAHGFCRSEIHEDTTKVALFFPTMSGASTGMTVTTGGDPDGGG